MGEIKRLHNQEFYRDRALEHYDKAKGFVRKKDFKEALYHYEEASRFDPENAEYLYCSGIMNRLLDDVERARHFLEKAYLLSPKVFEYKFDFGLILYRQEEYEEAKKIFERLKNDYGYEKNVYYNLAKANVENGYVEEASLLFNAILDKEEDWEVNQELGMLYMDIHKYGLSEKHLKTAIALNEKDKFSYYCLSKTFLKMGKHQEAIDILERLRDSFPEEEVLVKKNVDVIKMLMDI